MTINKLPCHTSIAVALMLAFSAPIFAYDTSEPAQMKGLKGWTTNPVFTIGETVDGYTPPGVPDGMGAFEREDTVVIVSNHELSARLGYSYTLASGAALTGARISSLTFDKATRELMTMAPAYDTIYNRAGASVDFDNGLDSSDSNGLNRLCSAGSVVAGQAGFVDDALLTGEETNGGTGFALDIEAGALWALPAMGRAGWESATALNIPGFNDTHVAILIGDDRADAALLLYVGKKQSDGNFIERNGLANGTLYMWVANDGSLSPADWNGTGTSRSGKFVAVENYNAAQAGTANFDHLGFATQAYLDSQKGSIGAFNFSRPEDVHTNPAPGKGNQIVFASTGRNTSINQGADLWGTTYVVDVKINLGRIQVDNITADISIVYDGDDAGKQDFGIRSPDNLVWAKDGMVYIQEDRSISTFGAASDEETSIWKLNPKTSAVERIGQIDRTAVPAGQVDSSPSDLGNWESSGIIDVTDEFNAEGERVLFFNTQAHSVGEGTIETENLVQGGQYLFISKPEVKGKGNKK
ncbi:MAG: PEP-CTERM sorting domain-containing protein [Cycloclasticus sp.]|nr:PEP-CTERM sorting domain-containing protein [Cycloclasticus sp.]MBG96529.1 PEP-CTERM sorting domain-containing protein [Cycloclasticus sp.]